MRQRDETIRQKSAALAEAESKIECFCCKDRPIEVVFNCGHGACRACTEKLTTEERREPGTNRFITNGPTIRVRKADPKCSQCGEALDPCVNFYAFRLVPHSQSNIVHALLVSSVYRLLLLLPPPCSETSRGNMFTCPTLSKLEYSHL